MAAERQEVAVQVLHVHRKVGSALSGINQHRRSDLARLSREFLDRVQYPNAVGHVDDGQQLRARRYEFVNTRHIEALVVFQHRHDAQFRALVRGHLLPGNQVGVVLIRCYDNLVAFADVLLCPCVSYQIQRLRCVARPDYLLRMFGSYEAGNFDASVFIEFGRFLAESVYAPMHIGIGGLVVVNQRLYNLTRFLGRGSVVQIDQWLAIDLPGQYRKVFSDLLHVKHIWLPCDIG